MPATLYAHPVSQPSRSASWFLEYKGDTTTERKVVDLQSGTHKTPEYLAKFPAGQVPAFETEDGFCFSEGAAIVKYLSKGVEEVEAKDAKEEARINEYIGKHLTNVRKCTGKFVRIMFLKPENWEETAAEGLKIITPTLEYYNGLLGKQPYIAGDHLTIADFLFVPEVDQIMMAKPEVLEPLENLKKYLKGMEEVKGYSDNFATMKKVVESFGEKK